MTKQLKQKLQQQYNEMYKIDYKEMIGSIIVCIGLLVLTYLYYSIIN